MRPEALRYAVVRLPSGKFAVAWADDVLKGDDVVEWHPHVYEADRRADQLNSELVRKGGPIQEDLFK
jgi:hypothetical protein